MTTAATTLPPALNPAVWNGPGAPEPPSPSPDPAGTFAPADDDELYGTGITQSSSPDGTFSGGGGTIPPVHTPSRITQQAAEPAGGTLAMPGRTPSSSGYPAAGNPAPTNPGGDRTTATGGAGGAGHGGGPGTTGHTWSVPWGGSGAAVVVTGGAFAVETDELRTFASALTSAADGLDDARVSADSALWEARCALPPPPESDSTVPLTPGAEPGFTGADVFTPDFDVVQDAAVTALTDLSIGTGSLDDVAGQLRALAADVIACADLYDQAEDGATPGGGRLPLLTGLSPWQQALGLLMVSAATTSGGLQLGAMGLGVLGRQADNEMVADASEGLWTIANDPALSKWVRSDLLLLANLALWAQQAGTGREAAAFEIYLSRTAQRLDPEVSQRLPDQVLVGSQMVPTSSLTPMQRVAYYLSLRAEEDGAGRYGHREGVIVTPRDGAGSTTVPPGTTDPFGLGTAVPVGLASAAATVTAPPRTAADTIRYSEDLQHNRRPEGTDNNETGTISVLRTTHEDGTRSWLVIVPGTTDWGSGDHETQDLLTNLQAVAGRPSDMESAVVTAMRQAGIAPGEEVGLYGHSQGAITVSNIAADPAVGEQFTVTSLLTAGGPTSGADLPSSVSALHLENTGDAVPALDAAANPSTPTRLTATLDTHGMDVDGYPHGSGVYAQAAEGLEENEPALGEWSQEFRSLTGDGEDGAVTEELLFDVRRDLAGDGAGLGDPVPQPQPQRPPAPVGSPTGSPNRTVGAVPGRSGDGHHD